MKKFSLFLALLLVLSVGLLAQSAWAGQPATDDANVDFVVDGPAVGLDAPVFTPPAEALLYDNGPLVNCPGCGAGGADESVLQTGTLLMNTYGWGHQVTAGNRIADQFTISDAAGWTVTSLVFYAYQTNAPTSPSPFTSVNYQIWDGPPNNPGSTVVFGDTVTNRLTSSVWANIYRVSETTHGATARAVYANTVSAGVSLPAGTYWLDWQADGSTAYSGPWAPPVTINGQATTGDALQYIPASGWAAAIDSGSLTPQDFPFLVYGDVNVQKYIDLYLNPQGRLVIDVCTGGEAQALFLILILANGQRQTIGPINLPAGFCQPIATQFAPTNPPIVGIVGILYKADEILYDVLPIPPSPE